MHTKQFFPDEPGYYVASSNRAGFDPHGNEFVGAGCIVDPIGTLIGETTAGEPVVAAANDPDLIAQAKAEYPRYVPDLPPSP